MLLLIKALSISLIIVTCLLGSVYLDRDFVQENIDRIKNGLMNKVELKKNSMRLRRETSRRETFEESQPEPEVHSSVNRLRAKAGPVDQSETLTKRGKRIKRPHHTYRDPGNVDPPTKYIPYWYDDNTTFIPLDTLNCAEEPVTDIVNGVAFYNVKIPGALLTIDCMLYTNSLGSRHCESTSSTKCPLKLISINSENPFFGHFRQFCRPSYNDSAFYTQLSATACFNMKSLEENRVVNVGSSEDANFSPYVTDGYRIGFISPFCMAMVKFTLQMASTSLDPIALSHGAGLAKCPQSVIWLNLESLPKQSSYVNVHELPIENFHGDGIYYQDCSNNFAVCFRILNLPGIAVRYHACPPLCGSLRPNFRVDRWYDWIFDILSEILPSIENLGDACMRFVVYVITAILDLIFHTFVNLLLSPIIHGIDLILRFHIPQSIVILLTVSRLMPWIMATFCTVVAWSVMYWLTPVEFS